ncbi:hypothetical protein [Sphingomonas sp. dw_22]|uniref:hypothetical protein n=1 Tax=Sphingomonas sp. dw_22 TaxID=2721175 RepID=UPI001BD21851|nr:hypothetical protein [Sphingomonas sp. dw_22]
MRSVTNWVDRLEWKGISLKLLLLPLVFAFFAAWCTISPTAPNVMTRIGLTHSIVAHGTLTIDEIAAFEKDRAFFKGHYYCDKAPGVSLICTPVVWIANLGLDLAGQSDALVSPDNKRTPRYFASAFACLFGALIPLSAIAVVLFYSSALRAGVEAGVARSATLIFAFGTPFLFWSTVVFGHATAAALLFIGFAQYWSTGRSRRVDAWGMVLAGFVLALAICVEFLAAPAAAGIGLLLATRDIRSGGAHRFLEGALRLAAGGVLPLAALLLYNWGAFGSPFHLGYSSLDGWEGMKTGFFGISAPDPAVLGALIFGTYRGILWLSPVLALAVYGCVTLLWKPAYRYVGLLALLIATYYFLVNSGYFYWDGGWSTGPRHVTPSLPLLVFGLALAYRDFSRPLRMLTIVTGIYSLIVVPLCALINVRAQNDGLPMLTGHIFPDLFAGNSQMFLVHIGLPFGIAIAIPVAVLLVFFWLFRPGMGEGIRRT